MNECTPNAMIFDAKIERMVAVITYAVDNAQVHNLAKSLVEKEEELQKLKREHDLAIIKGYAFE